MIKHCTIIQHVKSISLSLYFIKICLVYANIPYQLCREKLVPHTGTCGRDEQRQPELGAESLLK